MLCPQNCFEIFHGSYMRCQPVSFITRLNISLSCFIWPKTTGKKADLSPLLGSDSDSVTSTMLKFKTGLVKSVISFNPFTAKDVPLDFTLSNARGHLAALTRSHLIGDHPWGLTKEETTETMDPSHKTKGLWLYPCQWNLELVGAARLLNPRQFYLSKGNPLQWRG